MSTKGSLSLTSPDHPGHYGNNLECSWRIVGPVGHYLTFNFVEMDLPDTFNCSFADYIQIEETNATRKDF